MADSFINILYVEDDLMDQMAVRRYLEREHKDFKLYFSESILQTRTLVREKMVFDVVIADYLLKDGNAFDIFELGYPAPLIFITGAGDEEVAVKAMKLGAYDYLIKDTDRNYLKVLPITIRNAHKSYLDQGRIQLLESAVLNATDAIIVCNANLKEPQKSIVSFQNESFSKLFDYKFEETKGNSIEFLFGKETDVDVLEKIYQKLSQLSSTRKELAYYNKSGEKIWVEQNVVPIFSKMTLETHFVFFCRNISKRKRNEAALIQAKKEALEAKKAEEHFLAVMSHEIRTPINAIAGLINLLQDTPTNIEQLDYLKAIKTSTDNLLSLVNDILDLSKIEHGQIDFLNSPFDIIRLVKGGIDTLKYGANTKGIELSLNIDPSIPQIVLGDSIRCNQILINILSNAIKFTPNGSVNLDLTLAYQTEKKVAVKFIVKDTGVGIPKSKQEKIFNKYQQADNEVLVKFGGTGLGLYIVKQLVELQNGKLNLESEIGKGSTFSVEIEYGKTDAKLPDYNSITPSLDLRGTRILVGEDNLMNIHILQKMLSKWNAVVELCTNGEEVLNCLNQKEYDILLIDIQMPVLNGIDTIRTIREGMKLDIPIIVLTASAFTNKHEIIKEKINGFVQKPFDPIHLCQLIISNVKLAENKLEAIEQDNLLEDELMPNDLLFNLSYLNKVSGGNKQFVKEMIRIFISQATDVLQRLPLFMQKKEYEEIGKILHKIKSSARNLGNKELSKFCTDAENEIINEGKYDILNNGFKEFYQNLRNTKEQLERELIRMNDLGNI